MPKRSSHPVSVMNDLGLVQAVREGFSSVSLTIAPFIYEKIERKICRASKVFHRVAFPPDLCLGIIVAVTASGCKGEKRLLQPV